MCLAADLLPNMFCDKPDPSMCTRSLLIKVKGVCAGKKFR